MPASFDLIVKNGKCFIDGQLKTTDIGISNGKIKSVGKIDKTSNEQIFSLHVGWNLISYIGQDNIDLDEALPDDIEMLFTDIMSENIVAMRNEDGQWIGSLADIGWQHLKGYWVYVIEPVEFMFNLTDNLPKFVNNYINQLNCNIISFLLASRIFKLPETLSAS